MTTESQCVCISRSSALFLAPGPDLGPQPRPPALASNLCLPTLAPNLYLPVLAPNLHLPTLDPDLYLPELSPNFHLPALAPNLYFPTLGYNFITSQGPEFTHTNIFPLICTCIYCPCLRFVLPVRGLNLHLPYYWW